MTINDFKKYNDYEFGIKDKVALWGKDVYLDIDFPYDKKKKQSFLSKLIGAKKNEELADDAITMSADERLEMNMDIINQKFSLLADSKDKILRVFLDNGILDLAEQEVRKNPRATDEIHECYILDDGERVFIPISIDKFAGSFNPHEVTIKFDRDNNAVVELGMDLIPDYLDKNLIVNIKFDGSIEAVVD